jgi:hypothetical protein
MTISARAPIAFDRSDDLVELARARRDRVRFVHVPSRRYLAVDGNSAPGGATFQASVTTLYPVAYSLHFGLRKRGLNAPVGMLEALYWFTPAELFGDEADGAQPEFGGPRRWRLILPVPAGADEGDVEAAILAAARRHELKALDRLRVVTWEEGPSAQVLHLGPYAAEPETLRVLHAAIADAGLVPHGPHHEIYLNDPRSVGEANARTVLRQPVRWPDDEPALD